MEQKTWQRYMDRAIQQCDDNTVNMLMLLEPKVASVMLIKIGKELCLEDDWKKLSQQMKPTFMERIKWTLNSLKRPVRNANTAGS